MESILLFKHDYLSPTQLELITSVDTLNNNDTIEIVIKGMNICYCYHKLHSVVYTLFELVLITSLKLEVNSNERPLN